MKTIFFCFPGNEKLTQSLVAKSGFPSGEMEIRKFPDGESFVKILSDVNKYRVIVVCSLDHPDEKILPLYFLCQTLREMGAARIELIAPYLAYMRQDKRFQKGEAITSDAFAKLLSGFIDRLITVDPHLHRHHSLKEIYAVPSEVVHSANAISAWIKNNVQQALLIGPDEESRQWVEAVAQLSDVPFEILIKNRNGDKEVEVSLPHVDQYRNFIPVLVDDIISTAHTMIETIKHLKQSGMQPAICIGVHAVFSGNAYEELKNVGVKKIITCNTIAHPSNGIDLSEQIIKTL